MNEFTLVMLWLILTDPVRDIYANKWATGQTSWLKWHVIKWANFYPLAIYLFIKGYIENGWNEWYLMWIPLAWVLWWISAFAFKVPWTPFWFKYFKKG